MEILNQSESPIFVLLCNFCFQSQSVFTFISLKSLLEITETAEPISSSIYNGLLSILGVIYITFVNYFLSLTLLHIADNVDTNESLSLSSLLRSTKCVFFLSLVCFFFDKHARFL